MEGEYVEGILAPVPDELDVADLAVVRHAGRGSASEFVVIDARAFAEAPVARIALPRRVPVRFHGNWMVPEG